MLEVIRRRLLIAMAASAGMILSTSARGTQMVMATTTLWQYLASLADQPPFTQTKIESVLSFRLLELRRDEYVASYSGGPVHFAGGGTISNIDFRQRLKRNDDPGFLVLTIDGACVTLDDVREHYPVLQVTQHPRGRSLNEETSYTAYLDWGTISFGFAERNRTCLASVVLRPKAPAS